MSVLVVAAHPDDEVLGCGATMAKLAARGEDVDVLILGEGSGPILARELPGAGPATESDSKVVLTGALATLPLREARELFEREYLLTQINRFGGNISRTANFVGMERSALHRKLKSLGVGTTTKGGARVAYLEDDEAEVTAAE